jgi:predicted transcriptional regulator
MFSVKNRIKAAFQKVKAELNEHLLAINENTSEIQNNYEYIQYLENKVDKLSERLEKLELKLNQQEDPNLKIILKTLENYNEFISYTEIQGVTGLPMNLIIDIINNLMGKGLIIKKYINNVPYVRITFKNSKKVSPYAEI